MAARNEFDRRRARTRPGEERRSGADRRAYERAAFAPHPALHPALPEERSEFEPVAARERAYRRALLCADMAAAAAALPLGLTVMSHNQLAVSYLLVVPAFAVAAKLLGLYDHDELVVRKTTLPELPRLANLAVVFTLLAWLARPLIITGAPVGDRAVISVWLSLTVLTFLLRFVARRLAGELSSAERCLFIGEPAAFERLQVKLRGDRHVELVGAVGLDDVHGRDASRFFELRAVYGVHRLIIAPGRTGQETLDLVRAAKASGVRVSLMPDVLGAVGSSVVFDDIDGVTLLGVRRFGLTRSSAAVKRAFDLLGATAVTLVALPLLGAIALLIRLDSRGPVFFRQRRVGRDGRHFEIFKFRTMVDGADAMRERLAAQNETVGLFKIADDPRLTRVGRWLRRVSLDELPQLLNVLRGEMSLVGPRPLVADEDQRITGWDRRRLQLTPGMTGPWQVIGGARVPLAEMVKLDYLYVANWSLWSDIRILVGTVRIILARGNQ
jgi:exopolysaccharide biosynthesis polyprenyl glycosylphosphotransferase